MTDPLLIPCPHCNGLNRIPAARVGEHPKCGRCKNGGANHQECLDVGYTVAHSPLIKTALFASDPNWGRILAAVGRAGVPELDVSKIDVFLGEVCIASAGARSATYTEEQGSAVMAREEIAIRIELGRGTASETIWTTDLSHEYVKINAEYRT